MDFMYDVMVLLLQIVGVIVGLAAVLALPGYYLFLRLVKANILWTRVESGWCRIILKWGKYHRTIGPGLRWIGIPGVYTLYARKMKFFKSVTDKEGKAQAESHEDEDVSSFKTTRYPYALPFKDEEDSNGLHLSGVIALTGVMEDYEKAFFGASDWYAEMSTKILSVFRDLLPIISYDDDIVGRDRREEQGSPTISARLSERLNSPRNGGPSVLDELRTITGMKIEGVELRSIDPPPDWRAITLAPYKAQREKDAAIQQAAASAALFDDTNQALRAWSETHRNATLAQIEAKQRELRDRSLAKTPGYQQVDIRGLENADTAVIGGGGAGVMVGGGGRGKSNSGGTKKGKPTEEEARTFLEELRKRTKPGGT